MIFTTGVKYADPALAASYAADYPEMSMAALEVAHDSVMNRGGRKADDGRMLQGVIVRHLVMPTHATIPQGAQPRPSESLS